MSTNQFLIKTVAETMVSKIIRDIKTGTNRSLRNSIDLGLYFSKGPIQKEFFGLAKSIAHNSNNMYLPLIKRAFESVDERIIKTVGLNLGISSFTIGAKQIKELYDIGKEPQMWLQILDDDILEDTSVFKDRLQNFKSCGIYTFAIDNIYDDDKIRNVIAIASLSKESTFFLNIKMNYLSDDILTELKTSKNIIIFIAQNKEEINRDIFYSLRKSKLLYGFCKYYNDFKNMESEEVYLKEMISLGCLFGVYIDTPDTFNDYEHIRYEKICNSRITGKLPIILYDFYRDCNFIQEAMLHKKHLIEE
ncbi:hypothetical protein [Clostridium cadaveris]|uniref:Uncharacterized protein n=1 Tax=Clostridium cadaveris TaxID=1529 RepID=A0A1I2QBS5_9CLOT|nr:hypothetical protein [Clostridium cadaveris]MDM8313180.1 hypothetical protein [Clostridium cadaveris]NME66254.1 hypothetical protein [Clostridium cadaveris]SFG24829.1 hypothetical protein SAMN04487885_1389 [Clostridium cadaveris]